MLDYQIKIIQCKTCNQLISWDIKKREELGTKRPLNASDMIIHQCNGGNGETKSVSLQLKDQQQQTDATTTTIGPVIYPYSVKIEQTSKSTLITCHVYNIDLDKAREDCVKLFIETIADLKKSRC
jgi:hypothetical protein